MMDLWEPFALLLQLLGSLPPVWQTIFAFVTAILVVTYCVFQVIRASPWNDRDRKPPPPTTGRRLVAQENRRYKRRQ